MDNDLFIRLTPPQEGGSGLEESGEALASRSVFADAPSKSEAEEIPWSSREVVVRRTDKEIVRAFWWWRGEDLVIKLQWLVRGADDQWRPINRVFPPSDDTGPPAEGPKGKSNE